MTSFFSLNGSVRTPAATHPSTRDKDSFSPAIRPSSNNQVNDQHTRPRIMSQGRARNGYHPGVESTVPIPSPALAQFNGGSEHTGGIVPGITPFDIARSPPNPANKNTKHVPCKFFRQGTCQAGNACPFSHSTDPHTPQAPCKYFMKGNCKFGAKCALAHYLPDGRRVNRSELDYSLGMNGRSFNLGGRVEPPIYPNQDSMLASSILTQQQFQSPDLYSPQFSYSDQDDTDAYQDRYHQYNQGLHMPSIGTGLNSPPGSHFGSPPDDAMLPRSPVESLRTALNAPLPQSFDANGVSHIARYGPLGQSVPDKFGMKSPPGSFPRKNLNLAEALPVVRTTSKFASPLGSSPQTADDQNTPRLLQTQKISQPRMVSASVPRSTAMDDWDEGFSFESDLLPNSLHDEVLTPQEKRRRLSRPEQDLSGSREQADALAIPSGQSSKVGSPSAAGSPSRFSALWEEQRKRKGPDASSTSASAFGHVGSPLRETWMPNQASTSQDRSSVSGIAQELARMGLNRTESAESISSRPQPSGLRHASAQIGRFERAISNPKTNSRRIDEEGEGVFFPMDDENSKRNSVVWGGKSPDLDSIRDPLGDSGSLKEHKSGAFRQMNGVKPVFGFRP